MDGSMINTEVCYVSHLELKQLRDKLTYPDNDLD